MALAGSTLCPIFGADDPEEVDPLAAGDQPLGLHREAKRLERVHDVGRRLQLGVVLAAVAGDRDVEGVQGVIDGVVDVEGLFLVRRAESLSLA